MKHEIKLVCSAIEDLAFPIRPSREPSFLNLNNLLIKFNVAEELKQILATC